MFLAHLSDQPLFDRNFFSNALNFYLRFMKNNSKICEKWGKGSEFSIEDVLGDFINLRRKGIR